MLTDLARQVGLALHNVQLDTALQASLDELRSTNEELRASRVRIVAAGDAERRKLERNLHDGAQQHLVALAVKLRLAKDAVVDDPADAEAMIDEVRNDLQNAITELRALAHGIFPPLLMSGGLAEAMPAAAARAASADRHGDRGRAPQPGGGSCDLLLLHGGVAERRQACRRQKRPRSSRSGKTTRPSTGRWPTTAAGFDPAGAAEAGHGFLEHARPHGLVRWHGRGDQRRGIRHHHSRTHPARLIELSGQFDVRPDQAREPIHAGSPPASQIRRMTLGESSSLLT